MKKLIPILLILVGASLSLAQMTIFEAASYGTAKDIRVALQTYDINERDAYGQTPLIYAITNGNSATADELVSQGRYKVWDIETLAGWTPLMYYARHLDKFVDTMGMSTVDTSFLFFLTARNSPFTYEYMTKENHDGESALDIASRHQAGHKNGDRFIEELTDRISYVERRELQKLESERLEAERKIRHQKALENFKAAHLGIRQIGQELAKKHHLYLSYENKEDVRKPGYSDIEFIIDGVPWNDSNSALMRSEYIGSLLASTSVRVQRVEPWTTYQNYKYFFTRYVIDGTMYDVTLCEFCSYTGGSQLTFVAHE